MTTTFTYLNLDATREMGNWGGATCALSYGEHLDFGKLRPKE